LQDGINSNKEALNIISESFKTIFYDLNEKDNSFFNTSEILLKYEDLILTGIRFMRRYEKEKNSIFDPLMHKIDQRGISFLKKKKLIDFCMPILNEKRGDDLFRAVAVAIFGGQVFHEMLRICSALVLLKNIHFLKKYSSNKGNIEDNITRMAKYGVFGGEDEQLALSFIFRKPLLILSDFCYVEVSAFFGLKCDPIILFFDFKAENYITLLMKENVDFCYSKIRPITTAFGEEMKDFI